MIGSKSPVASQIEAIYRTSQRDPGLRAILANVVADDDEQLAEAIEVDGRIRISVGRPVELKRYLDAVPGLESREVALDAAIDVTLRSRSAGSRPSRVAVQELIAEYPQFRDAIREAAVLADAVVSTNGVRRAVRSAPRREVPSDFGPIVERGRSRYQLTKLLGSGSAGEVYQAIDRQLSERDRPAYVAIKLLSNRGRAGGDRQLLVEEAAKARRVLHDNVVRVLDRGVSDQDEDYIVYEHVEGGDLDTWFERKEFTVSPVEAARIVARIARGVQAAHSSGVVHCDLKPSNILVTDSGEPKVCDFGIAVRRSESKGDQNQSKPIGNIAFISPEQYRAEDGCLSPPSDVYALGGILYYLLTHEYPNGSSIEAVAQVHDARSGRPSPPSPRTLRRQIDEDLDAICRRAMSRGCSARHASAAALADDLEAWLRREPISWRQPSIFRVARLAARRRPGAFAGWVCATLAIILGSAAVGYWSSVAGTARSQMDAARLAMLGLKGELDFMKKNGAQTDILLMLTTLESMFGSKVFATPENRAYFWRERISAIRTLVDDATKAGRGSDFETLGWQGLLGLWLLNDNQIEEAEQVLNDNAYRWAARETAEDLWPKQIRLLAASAAVARLDAAAAKSQLQPGEREELVSLEKLLKTEGAIFPDRYANSPIRRPVLIALTKIYCPNLLNDSDALHTAKETLKKFEGK
jgi:hypothetical protein